MASVKVAVRVRPFNERELAMDAKCIIRMNLNKTIINNPSYNSKSTEIVSFISDQTLNNKLVSDSFLTASNTNLSVNTSPGSSSHLKSKEFVYDASYWSFNESDSHFISQSDVYNDLGKLTVNNAFDGYNACVCAYGQTGSGKSYSMMGQSDIADQEGLIPRICKRLFEKIEKKSAKSESKGSNTVPGQTTTYRAEVSYLEIYNEKVRDLLRSSDKFQEKLKVREHPKTGVYVQDLSQHIVVNYQDIEELLSRGNINRTTASTNMNDTSSRSHAIFTVKFSQVKFVENNIPSEIISKMNLVDLAGSERADSTGATGIRLKEGGNINKSLLTFINVISTLADISSTSTGNAKHYIPYRDSVLTWLLKDSLGGNSKTVILAAISPADINYVETMSTLRYANRAKNIINKPTVNEDPNVKLIRELRNEIIRLKSKLGENPLIDNSLQYGESISILDEPTAETDSLQQEQTPLSPTFDQSNSYLVFFEENSNISLEKKRTNCLSLSNKHQPYLISIDEAIPEALNGLGIYPLRHGKTLFGKDSATSNDVLLFGECVEPKQCYLTRLDNKCYLYPLGGYCQLNDRVLRRASSSALSDKEDEDDIDLGAELKHGDLILLGESNLFIYNNPGDLEEDSGYFDQASSRRIYLSGLVKKLSMRGLSFDQDKSDLDEESTCLRNEISILEERIKELSGRIDLSGEEVNRLKVELELERTKSKFQSKEVNSETLTIKSIGIERKNNESDYAIDHINTVENQPDDFISRDFDQHDEVNFVIEKFEKDEKLLNECLKNLQDKPQKASRLKSFIFELQSLRLKEDQLETDLRKKHAELDKKIERLNERRDKKLQDLSRLRERLHKNQKTLDLKTEMSALNGAEWNIENQVNECQQMLENDLDRLNTLNTELRIKKMYSMNGQSLEEMMKDEEVTIKRAEEDLKRMKEAKQASYLLIEEEFEKARSLMLAEAELKDSEYVRLKLEVAQSEQKHVELHEFLNQCLYENDEEKCLVENELAELAEIREILENGRLKELRESHKQTVDENMIREYRGLDELKEQDTLELNEDSERIQTLREGSVRMIQEKIRECEESVASQNVRLKGLAEVAEVNRARMNALLLSLEELERKRVDEEGRLFDEEMKMCSEYKAGFDQVSAQENKLEAVYRKKKASLFNEKSLIQNRLCEMVGPYKGMQLLEADFNPKFSQNDSEAAFNRTRTFSSNFVETSSLIQLNKAFSSNSSTVSSSSSSRDSQSYSAEIEGTLRDQVKKPLFETSLCKQLGISIEISSKPILCGKKLIDEHYEYLIEISLGGIDRWFILRRYSRIRQLHEQMSVMYPTLNCLVFPVRQLFNREILNRQIQLEHYLKCFIEVLLNDPACPIYQTEITSIVPDSNFLNLESSTSSSSYSYFINNNNNNNNNNHNESMSVTKEKLCNFCPFFEQTQADRSYLSKSQLKQSCYFDRKNSNVLQFKNGSDHRNNNSTINGFISIN